MIKKQTVLFTSRDTFTVSRNIVSFQFKRRSLHDTTGTLNRRKIIRKIPINKLLSRLNKRIMIPIKIIMKNETNNGFTMSQTLTMNQLEFLKGHNTENKINKCTISFIRVKFRIVSIVITKINSTFKILS